MNFFITHILPTVFYLSLFYAIFNKPNPKDIK